MTKHEFIFSDRYRITRHLFFWVTWCVAFNLLFHFPIHVFKGWNLTDVRNPSLQKLGMPLFFVKTLLVNSLFGVIVPQILFTYTVIYWLLPRFFYKRKFAAGVVAIAFICGAFFFIAVVFKFSPAIYNFITGMNDSLPTFNTLSRYAIIDQVTSLPIVAGAALMIKLVKRWWLKTGETALLASEKATAELQLLKAQVHPHFLFNTLNNIYFFTLSASKRAPEMIKKLSGMLYYILNECNQPTVPLEKEVNMIVDYMALEKIRYGDQMSMTIELPANYHEQVIAPLLLIPFVENSFKHGSSKIVSHSYIKLKITIDDNRFDFHITNNRPAEAHVNSTKGNIGLKNVKQRLQLLYPDCHDLKIITEPESFTVHLAITLPFIEALSPRNKNIKSSPSYAMA